LLLTLHRQENTDSSERLASIIEGVVKAAEATGLPLVFPVHPRTVKALTESGLNSRLEQSEAVCTTEPLGYLEFLGLLVGAAAVLSDSGGVQEEACILGVPCVTLRDNTERPETVEVAANRLVGADTERIVQATREALSTSRSWSQPFGDGRSGLRIAEHAASLLG
jgi:UDP-N-acetylglucosamine 2-epimerase (non-hydrolysing)